MDFLDFIAFFLYTIIFSFIFSVLRKKIKDEKLRVYHRNAFWLKVLASFSYSLFVLYISAGDTTTLFYPEGHNLYMLILKDPSKIDLLFGPGSDVTANLLANPNQIGYFKEASNFMVLRITAILCFFSFGKYMVVNLMFSMIAFTGIWKLYLFFCEQYPELYKQFAVAILFLPTFTFWSSGILKDPLAISALGWFTYSLYQVAYKKRNLIKNLLIIALTVYLFSVVKVYILVAYLPAFIVFLLLKNAMILKNNFTKVLLVIVFIVGSIVGFVALSGTMQGAVEEYSGNDLTEGISTYQDNYEKQRNKNEGSYFSLGVEFDGSTGSLIKIAPAAIVATFFRPFLWESRKISTLLSSLESLAIMLFTLYVLKKVGLKKFFGTILKKPIVLYCFFFAMVFALFVGATTLNFGTLVRYKIPAMPFYVISLILILYFNNKLKVKPGILPQPISDSQNG
ncbi:MAG: hypothetical protein ABIP35_09820 [Ginsengibacter sp.]